jgi:hypothetical protein
MDEKTLKELISELAQELGPESVCGALVTKGLSPSTAELLSRGSHKGGFKRRTAATVRAYLAEQGKLQAS